MRKKRLGHTDIEVSCIGLGCMGMSFLYGVPDDAESTRTIHRALELGVNFLDTAEVYGFGRNEELLGEALAGRRDQVVLATKFGFDPQGVGLDGTPENVRRACADSLRRLNTDVIDLYYLHRADPDVPLEETVGAMADLVQAGKVRAIGLCEVGVEQLARANAVHPVAAVQSEYSLWTRDCERAVLASCRDQGVTYVAYSPLGRGFLTATIETPDDLAETDRRRKHPRFREENIDRNVALLGPLKDLAAAKGATPSQIALAWVLSRGDHVVPIPGTKRRRYLEENVKALEIGLTAAEIAALDDAFKPDAAAGERYPRRQMPTLQM